MSINLWWCFLFCLDKGVKWSTDSKSTDNTKCFVVVFTPTLLKQSGKRRHLVPTELLAYPDNTQRCAVAVLKTHICSTKEIRSKQSQILPGYQSWFQAICKHTLARRLGVWTCFCGVHTACVLPSSQQQRYSTGGRYHAGSRLVSHVHLHSVLQENAFLQLVTVSSLAQSLLGSFNKSK